MRNRTMASRRWAASCPGASGPPVQGARIPRRRSAPHASGRITGGARRGWVGGVNAMGRGGDPGVPGVRQGGGAGDPGSGERVRQRGTIGAPRQAGAQDPAGQGAAPVTRQAREVRAFGGTETVDNLPASPPPFQPTRGEGEVWAF
jgi:hypothetical protein